MFYPLARDRVQAQENTGYCHPVKLEVTPRSACSLRVILCCRLLTRLKASFYLSRCYHELRALSGWHISSQFFRAQLSCSRVCSLELAFLQSPSVHGQRLCSGPAGECVCMHRLLLDVGRQALWEMDVVVTHSAPLAF